MVMFNKHGLGGSLLETKAGPREGKKRRVTHESGNPPRGRSTAPLKPTSKRVPKKTRTLPGKFGGNSQKPNLFICSRPFFSASRIAETQLYKNQEASHQSNPTTRIGVIRQRRIVQLHSARVYGPPQPEARSGKRHAIVPPKPKPARPKPNPTPSEPLKPCGLPLCFPGTLLFFGGSLVASSAQLGQVPPDLVPGACRLGTPSHAWCLSSQKQLPKSYAESGPPIPPRSNPEPPANMGRDSRPKKAGRAVRKLEEKPKFTVVCFVFSFLRVGQNPDAPLFRVTPPLFVQVQLRIW